jgi:DNA-binding phage protein
VAHKAQLNRENLYRMLSEQGNPQLASLTALLEALELRLAVAVK